MKRILSLLQIKTVRSAWLILVGSALMLAFGVYQALTSHGYSLGNPNDHFEIMLLLFWLVVLGAYIAMASWALFSVKGRSYLRAQERLLNSHNRTLLWYFKFLFACFAAGFATMMLLGVLSLPFAGYAGLELMFGPNNGLYLLIASLVWSPLIFRYLE